MQKLILILYHQIHRNGASNNKIDKIYTNELYGSLKDNADSATKLATPQKITFNEDVVSIASTFDGTQDVGIALTLKM